MNEELQRRMPFSLEAEQSVLASIMIDPACMDKVSMIVKSEDFYVDAHAEIFRIMLSMYLKSRNIDVVTLLSELKNNDVYDEESGREYLKLIADVVPTASNAEDYAKIVRNKAILRRLIKAGEEIAEDAYTEIDDADLLLENAEEKIYSIADDRENKSFTPIRNLMATVQQQIKERKINPDVNIGTPTGFPALDSVIVGLSGSDLILVGARPGMGKTAFAMNIATQAAEKLGKTVCVFSLEMSGEQLALRMLSSEAQVDGYKMRTGRIDDPEWKSIAYAASKLAELDILIDDTPGASVANIIAKMRRVKNPGLIVIDYLQLMQGDERRRSDNRVQEVGDISRGLKLLAKKLNIPVIACAQLSRGPESRTDKRPMLSDLRDSGAIEQDADIVLFLYRDEYYKDKENTRSLAEVIVAKNRHGSLDKVKLGFIGQYTKFTNLSPEQSSAVD
ncbi:MAG: replicative DNA helicase [Clostridia bacterium]|nr:replicative DNA helicase [Clostridia bacterium]